MEKNLTKTPKSYMLRQNYPNPFNPTTTIEYSIPKEVKSEMSKVKMIIYDVLGKEVATLVNTEQRPGNYEVKWNAADYASGIYFYTLTAGDFVSTKKLLLIK